ncbi:Rv1733c family protein [Nocardia thraciensis]
MTEHPMIAQRIWRTAPWSPSPLLRPSDRLEGVIQILAVVVVLAAVPLCGAIGTARYGSTVVEARAENATKVPVTALIIDDPVQVTKSRGNGPYDERFHAEVEWNTDGRSGAATMEVDRTARVGDPVSVWLGPDGSRVDPPVAANSAVWRGIGLGSGTLAGIWGTTAAVLWLTAWAFGRHHGAAWAREWHEIDRPIEQDRQ